MLLGQPQDPSPVDGSSGEGADLRGALWLDARPGARDEERLLGLASGSRGESLRVGGGEAYRPKRRFIGPFRATSRIVS